MKPLHLTLAAAAGVGIAVALIAFAPAAAQKPAADPKLPASFPYTIDKNGHREPKAQRITAADGSWREEVRDGSCVTVKEQNSAGEYHEVRKC